jgi:2'-phosphotransferase
MSRRKNNKTSRTLSTILRHKGLEYGLKFNDEAYTLITPLLQLQQMKGVVLDDIQGIVKNNDKKRFTIKKNMIRANQGHSGKIAELINDAKYLTEIEDASEVPLCVHGTYKRFKESILKGGLSRMSRKHIHCAGGMYGEVTSGMRGDCDMYIYIDVKKAMGDGITFYKSDNDVILTTGVDGILDAKYFEKIEN